MAEFQEKDEMRLCPTCRVPISVLATRCRHCGEEVGRPRKEEHKLTLKDLGGEASTNYTVSGNVMDALEAFREEQISAQDYERKQRDAANSTWFGKRNASAGAQVPRSDNDLPELNDLSRDLANLSGSGTSTPHARQAPRRNLGPTLQDRAMQAGMVLVGLVVLYVAGTFAWGKYQENLEVKEAALHPVVVSNAEEQLKAGRNPVDVLGSAVDAVNATDSPENRQALETVRARVLDDVDKLLNAPEYARETLDKASMMATKAAVKDSAPNIQQLDKTIKAELDAYSLILMSIDVKTQRVKFKLHDPSYPKQEEEVGVNDYVGGRFVVQSILPNQVRLVDTKRKSPTGQRAIIARPQEPVTGG